MRNYWYEVLEGVDCSSNHYRDFSVDSNYSGGIMSIRQAEMKTVIKNGGLGIRQYIEKLKGTLCTHIVYDVGVSGILPFSLPPA
jgi:hypothetical protein